MIKTIPVKGDNGANEQELIQIGIRNLQVLFDVEQVSRYENDGKKDAEPDQLKRLYGNQLSEYGRPAPDENDEVKEKEILARGIFFHEAPKVKSIRFPCPHTPKLKFGCERN